MYTLLNPDYIHIARTNSTDVETIEQLTKYYIFYQKRCQVQLKELKQNLESCKVLFYDTSDLKYQQRIKYYHESIEALDAIEQIRRRLWNASQIIKL